MFDNIDKDVKPRHMTSDNLTWSLHYVQSYAVKDRVNYDCLSGERRTEVCILDILPTKEDYDILKKNFAVLVSRVMVKFIPYFTSGKSGSTRPPQRVVGIPILSSPSFYRCSFSCSRYNRPNHSLP